MKKYYVLVAVSCCMTLGAVSGRAQTADHKPEVIRLDPAMDEIVSPEAELQVVKSGFGFTEGLNWVHRGKTGYLVFSDVPANVVDKLTPDGTVSVLVNESGYRGPWNGYMTLRVGHKQNNGKDPKDPLYRQFMMLGSDGLTIDPQGRLVICNYGGRSVDRIEKNGKRVVLADRYDGKRLNGPNDVVVKKDGAIYFTDTWNWALGDKDPSTELHSLGIYMIKDGKVTLVINDIRAPNGLALSPDEKYLYANLMPHTIRRYNVQPDDTLTNGQLLIDLKEEKTPPGETPGYTDGVRVDSKGNIYSSGPVGVWIISPEGKHIGTIRMPEGFANFTFGDADDKTLYIGGHTTIYKIRMKVAGKHSGKAVGEY